MKRSIPTLLIMLVVVATCAAYWFDIELFINQQNGFVTKGSVWLRYGLLLLPFLLAYAGFFSVRPRAISVFRVRNPFLGVVFLLAGLAGFAFGGIGVYTALTQPPFSRYQMVLGILHLWYGVWMVRSSIQMFLQRVPSPSKSALWGVLAAVPFCMLTVYRVLVKAASLYRLAPTIRIFSALFAMLWFGMLLRGLYIAMVRSRVRWMYIVGLATFLFCGLECVQEVHYALTTADASLYDMAQGIHMGIVGIVAACVSLSMAVQGEVKAPSLSLVEQELAETELDFARILEEEQAREAEAAAQAQQAPEAPTLAEPAPIISYVSQPEYTAAPEMQEDTSAALQAAELAGQMPVEETAAQPPAVYEEAALPQAAAENAAQAQQAPEAPTLAEPAPVSDVSQPEQAAAEMQAEALAVLQPVEVAGQMPVKTIAAQPPAAYEEAALPQAAAENAAQAQQAPEAPALAEPAPVSDVSQPEQAAAEMQAEALAALQAAEAAEQFSVEERAVQSQDPQELLYEDKALRQEEDKKNLELALQALQAQIVKVPPAPQPPPQGPAEDMPPNGENAAAQPMGQPQPQWESVWADNGE